MSKQDIKASELNVGLGVNQPTESKDQYSCFRCDSLGGGMYKPHEGKTVWYIGHSGGQGHYACENCKDELFDASPL